MIVNIFSRNFYIMEYNLSDLHKFFSENIFYTQENIKNIKREIYNNIFINDWIKRNCLMDYTSIYVCVPDSIVNLVCAYSANSPYFIFKYLSYNNHYNNGNTMIPGEIIFNNLFAIYTLNENNFYISGNKCMCCCINKYRNIIKCFINDNINKKNNNNLFSFTDLQEFNINNFLVEYDYYFNEHYNLIFSKVDSITYYVDDCI